MADVEACEIVGIRIIALSIIPIIIPRLLIVISGCASFFA